METHDLARPLVRDQSQIHKRFLGPDIGQVGHPHLVAAAHLPAFDQVLKHRKIRVNLRGSGPFRTLSLHQQPRFAQLFKQPIPAHLHSRRRQLRFDQVVELPDSQARLMLPLGSHQLQHQLPIHFLPAPYASARVIILRCHVRQFTQPGHLHPGVGFDRLVRRPPACFFLNPSRLSFISSQATARKARSSASSICASANASFTLCSSLRSRAGSLISSAFSTRIILPYCPLPNRRTHPITVPPPLIWYLRRTSSTQAFPDSTSPTHCILKPLLYRIAFIDTPFSSLQSTNLFQDGTSGSKPSSIVGTGWPNRQKESPSRSTVCSLLPCC